MSIMNGMYLGAGLLLFGVLIMTINAILQKRHDEYRSKEQEQLNAEKQLSKL